ncbi:MAG: CsbD family protein, partial [Acidobacteriota bacterium]|nr:CsbD family protein [Acidobacteriota bacterium]
MTDGKYKDGSVTEEVSAFGERVKGATKDGIGDLTGNRSLEREGERENAEGRQRQASNDVDVFDETVGVRGRTVGDSRNLVTGMYDSPDSAGKAYHDLTNRHGYKADDISVVMSDETRKRHFAGVKPGNEFKEGSKAAEGAGVGGGIGIGVGAALGAVVAAATAIAIPGLGLIVAGPIAGAIAGAGAGAATGTLLGALIGAGIPED